MVARSTSTPATDTPHRSRPLRIALFGHFGSGNLGNEGSLEAVLAILRRARPDAEIKCICVNPQQVEKDHGIPALALNWRGRNALFARLDRLLLRVPGGIVDLIHTIANVPRYDVIVVPGTGILDDFGLGPMGMPYGIFKWSLLSRLFGVKFWMVSIGAGPIHHPVSRWLMKSAARLATFRSYRDEISRDYMTSIGFDSSRDPICPDVAFSLAPPTAERANETAKPMTIGVGVMTYYGWDQDPVAGRHVYENYLAKISAFTLWLLDQGHNVRILTGETSDQLALDDLTAILNRARPGLAADRIAAEVPRTLHDLMHQMSGCNLVVATRFHNIVCALKTACPAISIGYARKNDVLLAQFGLDKYSQSIETFELDWLKARFAELCKSRETHVAQIKDQLERLRQSLGEQNDELLKQLPGRIEPAALDIARAASAR